MIDGRHFVEQRPGHWCPRPDWLTTPQTFVAAMRDRDDRIAIVDGDLRYTYGEMADAADALAGRCLKWGLRAGDRVAVYAPNSAVWAVAQLAVALCNAVVVPINVRARPAEIAAILTGARPRMAILTERFMTNPLLERYEQACSTVATDSRPELAIVSDGVSIADIGRWIERPRNDTDGASASSAANDQSMGSDPFIAFWTSGTTGQPKSIVHDWASLLSSVWDWTSMLGFGTDDAVVVSTRPFYYIAGNAVQLMGALLHGAQLVVVASLKPRELLSAVRENNATHLLGGPHLHGQILQELEAQAAPRSLSWASIGGDAPPTDLVDRLRTELGVRTVVQTYGMTELHGFVTTTLPEDSMEDVVHNSGICLPGVEIEIVGDDGEELPDGETGEITVRGRAPWGSIVDGALRRADATTSFRTGDLGRISDGRLEVVGRLAGLIKVTGERVHIDDVEAIMRKWPEVREVVAYSVPDRDRVNVVGVAVELEGTADPGVAEIEALVQRGQDELSPPKRPRVISVVPAGWDWPRNVAGKMRRREAELQLERSELLRVDLREGDLRAAMASNNGAVKPREGGIT